MELGGLGAFSAQIEEKRASVVTTLPFRHGRNGTAELGYAEPLGIPPEVAVQPPQPTALPGRSSGRISPVAQLGVLAIARCRVAARY